MVEADDRRPAAAGGFCGNLARILQHRQQRLSAGPCRAQQLLMPCARGAGVGAVMALSKRAVKEMILKEVSAEAEPVGMAAVSLTRRPKIEAASADAR